jgi:hypothetical protein
LYTLTNSLIGYLGCIILFLGIYYSNIFSLQYFPFLAQELFDGASNSTNYVVYQQQSVLDDAFEVDPVKLAAVGTPWLTGSYLAYLITSNMGFTATFVHMLLEFRRSQSWVVMGCTVKSQEGFHTGLVEILGQSRDSRGSQ